MSTAPTDPAASALAPVAPRGAARASVPGGPAAPGSPPLAAGGKTPGPAGPPIPLPGLVPTSPHLPEPCGTGAGTPDPADPGAGSPDKGETAPGCRARDETPAGGEAVSRKRDPADTSPPAGSTGRTYTITLPAGTKLLSLNGREHWASRHRRSQALKKAAWAMALQGKVPPLGRIIVIAEYRPPDRRRRDADNIAASVKAAIDGIVAAGVIPDDECPRYVSKIACTIGEPFPKGMLVLHLIEVTA